MSEIKEEIFHFPHGNSPWLLFWKRGWIFVFLTLFLDTRTLHLGILKSENWYMFVYFGSCKKCARLTNSQHEEEERGGGGGGAEDDDYEMITRKK